MTFKQSLQNDLRMASDYELQSLNNGVPNINNPSLAASLQETPLPCQEVQDMAAEEMYWRYQDDPRLLD